MSKPEITFKMGAVRASIFKNTIERNGQAIPLPKVVLEVRYRDKNGEWKGTNSLSMNELPKAILALQKAYEFLLDNRDGVAGDKGSGGPPASDDDTNEDVTVVKMG